MSHGSKPEPVPLEPWIKIEDQDELYRLVTEDQIAEDGLPNSGAFSGGTGYISIDIAKATEPAISVERFNKAGVRLAVFQASSARVLGQEPTHVPFVGFESHAELHGEKEKIPHGVRRKLAKSCRIMPGVVSRGPVSPPE